MKSLDMTTPKTYGLTHLAIAVNDIERTRVFYQQVFDMQTMYYQKGFLQMNTPGNHDILVFEEKGSQSIGVTGGIAHFGFRLKDPKYIDDVIDKVITAGGKIMDKGEFVPGSPYVFFKDPDGYEVEVWYELF